MHVRAVGRLPAPAVPLVEDDHGRVERDHAALAGRQLSERRIVRAGLAQDLAVDRGYLVGTDDDRFRSGHRARFFGRETRGEFMRRFPR